MDSTWLETNNSTIAVQKRAIEEELVRGREWAYRLQVMMLRTTTIAPPDDATTTNTSSLSADHHRQQQLDDLVAKILGSFTAAISLLNSADADADADKLSQVPEAASNSPSSDHLKPFQDSTLSNCKPSATSKHPRGSYKRRKTSGTWSRESPTLVDDGHAWRKYGQKVILNAEYPRNYFRCTHKFDQRCQATKQVQKIQEDPPVFRTTYHGRHTCKPPIVLQQEAPQIIHLDAAATTTSNARDSSVLLSFESTQVQPNTSNETFTAAGLPQVKEEVVHDLFQIQPPSTMSSSSNHHFLHLDFKTFETSALSSGSDDGDVMSSGVYSCSTASTHSQSNSLDMDMELDVLVGSMVNDFDYFSEFELET